MDGLRWQGWIILIGGLLDERRLKPDVIDLYDLVAYFGEQPWVHCPSRNLGAWLCLPWMSFQREICGRFGDRRCCFGI